MIAIHGTQRYLSATLSNKWPTNRFDGHKRPIRVAYDYPIKSAYLSFFPIMPAAIACI